MILVTGATGLVGGNLIWQLLQENERVVAIRRPSSNMEPIHAIFRFYTSTPDLFLSRIDWKIADVLDAKSINEAMSGISVVYHCAAVVSLGTRDEAVTDTNVTGTRNVVRAALKNHVARFCFVSSIAACGNAVDHQPIDETCLWTDAPHHSIYSCSKYYSEQEVWEGVKAGLSAVIVNPGVILGVSGTSTGSSQLFAQVQKGLMFYTLGGSGYVDVRDVAKAMILLTQSDISGQRFILVGGNYSNKEILNMMADGFGKHRPVLNVGRRLFWCAGALLELAGRIAHFHPLIDRATARMATTRKYYSAQKLVQAINFKFTPLDTCIRDVCNYLKK